MASGLYIITGTSKGIGEALARTILEEGNTVLGVARTASVTFDTDRYHHMAFDLSEISRIDEIVDRAVEIAADQGFEFLCLVNNAAVIDPIGPIERCEASEIEFHLKVGLTAPMVLTSRLMSRFKESTMRKKVVFLSSGAAFNPMPETSVYCTSKAGITMFARSIAAEQKDREKGFEVHSVGPGMVETSMQQMARSKSPEEYAMGDFFRDAYDDGKVQEPGDAAAKIYAILQANQEPGAYVSV